MKPRFGVVSCKSVNGEQFYINYSLNGEHYVMGPYRSRRFAMSHIDEVRRQPGVSNVFSWERAAERKVVSSACTDHDVSRGAVITHAAASPPPWSDFSLCHPSQHFLITVVIQASGANA